MIVNEATIYFFIGVTAFNFCVEMMLLILVLKIMNETCHNNWLKIAHELRDAIEKRRM